ncbi:3-methyl-2-oxobutanoate hydroxymethyltransferase [Pseudalkalibacillus salsuginis]|uniref:3-methyl-2-oxobutanoate hydroxymethyltransferase n=1 Tax=Pseudalkalibacillus salsuginis TaxID=2910972 RepID=UPI001F4522E8|nr:3-methyl-2-oxobutanoate hydroxymethyltransferase [Pseudalkalibacillus salsuginis]MCF6408208.1 3-methyl-2-oxobutanoate hydroxymethyltransferase [Pseudalkalibacillus salsuginis]
MKRISDFKKMKEQDEKIVMLTSYDYPSAQIAEQANIDLILVGDSLGMVVLGYESTIPVTMEDMIHHTKAVKRGASETFVVTDMPFMSYHTSTADALKNAARLMQEASADAVKVEGAGEVIEVISRLTGAGVPVMGHLGLTPQSVAVLGGYKVQGKDAKAAEKLIGDAFAIEEAGAFALVLECVPRQLAELVSKRLSIPTIGIGAGIGTDGQVLVYHDLIGYGSHRPPKFVKQYTNVSGQIGFSIKNYVEDVKERKFPEEKHTFTMKEEQLVSLYGGKV